MKNLFNLFLTTIFILSITACDERKSSWETVSHDINAYRLKVPHGWIVDSQIVTGTASCFVPDEKHEWVIDNEIISKNTPSK